MNGILSLVFGLLGWCSFSVSFILKEQYKKNIAFVLASVLFIIAIFISFSL